jgi:hypothetical protein
MIRDHEVHNHLRLACCALAYPDPRHCCRIHILGLVAHSARRVTAALCLKLGGASDEEIALSLYWHMDVQCADLSSRMFYWHRSNYADSHQWLLPQCLNFYLILIAILQNHF